MQRLLLDGIGLTLNDMRRLARWHGRVVNPALASASASMAVAQRIARNKAAKRKADQQAKLKPDEAESRQQEKQQPGDRRRHSLASRIWRQLSVWMTTGRLGKEVPKALPAPFFPVQVLEDPLSMSGSAQVHKGIPLMQI